MNSKKSYLITGGAGFIGSHIAQSLIREGCHVVVLDNLNTGKIENIEHLHSYSNFTFIECDVRNRRFVYAYAEHADTIIHLAASVGVDLVIKEPINTILNNIHCTETVLDAAYKFGCKVFIASSSEVYGQQNSNAITETTESVIASTKKSRWSYSASKIVDEFLAQGYYNLGLDITIGRFFNIIGVRQNHRFGAVVPRFIRQALRNESLTVHGDGTQKRCFCNVSDAASAILNLLDSDIAKGDIFNIGSQEEISIFELALLVKEITCSSSEISFIPYDALQKGFAEINQRKPDLSLIESTIGWSPKVSLRDSLIEIIKYEQKKSNTKELIFA